MSFRPPQEQTAPLTLQRQQRSTCWPLETSLVTWTLGGDAMVLTDYTLLMIMTSKQYKLIKITTFNCRCLCRNNFRLLQYVTMANNLSRTQHESLTNRAVVAKASTNWKIKALILITSTKEVMFLPDKQTNKLKKLWTDLSEIVWEWQKLPVIQFWGWSKRNPGSWITLKFSLPLLSMGHKWNHCHTENGAAT